MHAHRAIINLSSLEHVLHMLHISNVYMYMYRCTVGAVSLPGLTVRTIGVSNKTYYL